MAFVANGGGYYRLDTRIDFVVEHFASMDYERKWTARLNGLTPVHQPAAR